MHDHIPSGGRRLRVGSLFSGYGGLDLAVEHVFNAETIWFFEINEPVARAFAHHWPDAPNLGDVTTIDWRDVPPVDILSGGFPCQDVSTVGKRACLAPGTRSGLWSHMAAAIDALEFMVIENVRGLLSAPAVRNLPEGATDARSNPATTTPGDDACNPSRGGTRPAASGRRCNPTSQGVWRRGGRPGRPAARCTMDRLPASAIAAPPGLVEWLTGLERAWVTEPAHGLTDNQQLTALGNGVLPLQATQALGVMTSMPY